MKVYISLPITGKDIKAQRERAAALADALASAGHEPVNPLANGLPYEAPRAEHMRKDLRLLLRCNAMVLCEGWEHSRGCLLERQVAAQCGIAVVSEERFVATGLPCGHAGGCGGGGDGEG